ncbi:cytochrome c [Sulfitobacter sp. D35]|uniref:c-type cytochrome n=1 Tax=Sulfitobacter sp. D35 TaxID=3083252 RepID=UPI00296FCF93|nr:cytochrome c [Sulfitobacter sp. D35]MDW4497647.1 cytochrome c [Sulfitobacter sp. D35]
MKPAVLLLGLLWPLAGLAQDNSFRLSAPQEIVETGLLNYLLPRFSLKHGIRVTLTGPGEDADATLGDTGTPVFAGPEATWHLDGIDTPAETEFSDWLLSEIGQNTVASFQRDGAAPFGPVPVARAKKAELAYDGDPAEGETISLTHCGRCHVINERNRMKGMGSTPSFAVLRTLAEWEVKFASFYALNPHQSFTQVDEITAPFDPMRPPPIAPMRISVDDIEAILAYVATIPPADLGAPIQSQ